MWVMKEYGVEKSWTKMVSLLSPFGRMGYISPLFVSENGDEVLVKLGTDISLYETRNASYKSLEIHSAGYRLQVQAITYFESLASPHVGDDCYASAILRICKGVRILDDASTSTFCSCF
ncbi:hypothetical protein T459_06332 [Capsicum annuum]|uniref:F-box associated domain-containing protein n=1 Tax=Capsicum annuum TaxID=4072 RepID=A0A2G3AAD9_CAPAN|nr:hypothetical protein T459_06332 [Capsicum annuum]